MDVRTYAQLHPESILDNGNIRLGYRDNAFGGLSIWVWEKSGIHRVYITGFVAGVWSDIDERSFFHADAAMSHFNRDEM